MVTKKASNVKKKTEQKPLPAFAGVDEKIKLIKDTFDGLTDRDKLKVLRELGCASDYYTCQSCDDIYKKTNFYMSTEPNCASGITKVCKKCAEDIAIPKVNGTRSQPTKQTVDNALYALNKPFLEKVWDSSLLEAANQTAGKGKTNVWASYIKNIQMVNYYNLTYRDSDNYTGGIYSIGEDEDDKLPDNQVIIEQFEKNKSDVLRLLGYLPFEKEKISDQPQLYGQTIGMLDASEDANDDMMRTSSIISIVRGFLQQSQIDDMIANLTQDLRNAEKNISSIKSLQEMKKNLTAHITKLAEQSCISLKNSRNATKGENTWTGKTKKIKELNLRDGQVNGFDIATCRGMQQVQEISDASIMKQLALDESEWSDMVAEMRVDNQKLRKERDNYKEINRILLQENLDLKDYMEENNLDPQLNLKNLKDIYSVFSGKNETTDTEYGDEDNTDDSVENVSNESGDINE